MKWLATVPAVLLVLGGCGGEVRSEQGVPAGTSDDLSPAPAESAVPGASGETPPPAGTEVSPPPSSTTACTPAPPPYAAMTCAEAEHFFSVVATGLTWADPSAGGAANATAVLDILYRDDSPHVVWSYPGVRIVSSDPRVEFVGHSAAVGSTPGLYTVGDPCMEAPAQEELKLSGDIASGTKITLTLSPVLLGAADVTDASYSECGGLLQKTTYEFVVP